MVEQSGEGGDAFPLTPMQGTFIIGVANALGATFAVTYIRHVGRRPIFITGQLLMSL